MVVLFQHLAEVVPFYAFHLSVITGKIESKNKVKDIYLTQINAGHVSCRKESQKGTWGDVVALKILHMHVKI